MLTLLAVVCGALAAALLVFHTHFRLRALPMAAALLLAGAALLLCRAGMNRGLLVFRPSCTAEEAAGAFFRAVSEGDSDAALALVADGTLPLGQSEPDKMVCPGPGNEAADCRIDQDEYAEEFQNCDAELDDICQNFLQNCDKTSHDASRMCAENLITV